MQDFEIKLPDELVDFITNETGLGHATVDGYIQERLIKPLLDDYRDNLKKLRLSQVEAEIRTDVEDKRSKVQLRKLSANNK